MYKAIRTNAYVSVYNQVPGIFRIGFNSRLWHVENAYILHTMYNTLGTDTYVPSTYAGERGRKKRKKKRKKQPLQQLHLVYSLVKDFALATDA
jgi:hypothetical protein